MRSTYSVFTYNLPTYSTVTTPIHYFDISLGIDNWFVLPMFMELKHIPWMDCNKLLNWLELNWIELTWMPQTERCIPYHITSGERIILRRGLAIAASSRNQLARSDSSLLISETRKATLHRKPRRGTCITLCHCKVYRLTYLITLLPTLPCLALPCLALRYWTKGLSSNYPNARTYHSPSERTLTSHIRLMQSATSVSTI